MAVLIFFAFNILAIQIPGLVLYQQLVKKEYGNEFKLLASYFLGMMLLFVEYFVESVAGIPYFTLICSLVMCGLGIYLLAKKKLDIKAPARYTWVLFTLVFVFSFANFTYPYMFAKSGQSVQVYHDILFHVGNITSLSRNFFNSDIRVYGLTFYYHFFYDLIYAICKHITGLNAYDMLLFSTPFISAWWASLTMMICGKRLEVNVTGFRKLITFGAPMFAGIIMYPILIRGFHFPLSGVTEQITDNCNAIGMGMAIGVLLIEIFAQNWDEKFTVKEYILVVALFAALTGSKGPIAAVILATLWIVNIVESIINKKFNLGRNLALVLSSGIFVVIYKVVDTGIGVTEQNANRAMRFTSTGNLSSTRVTQIFEALGFGQEQYENGILLVFALILLICAIMGPCVLGFIGYVTLCTKELVKSKHVDNVFDWIAIGGSIIGLGGVVFIDISGYSQQYCLIGVAPLYAYCVVKYIQRGHLEGLQKFTEAMLVVGLLCFGIDVAHNGYESYLQNQIIRCDYEDESNRISSKELEGMLWIRDNVPENALLAYDRYSEEEDHRDVFFYCSAFSERQVFIEGYHYSNVSDETAKKMLEVNKTFYGGDSKALAAMEEQGIDYLVVSRVKHKGYKPAEGMKQVYGNEDIAVYAVGQ